MYRDIDYTGDAEVKNERNVLDVYPVDGEGKCLIF